MEREIPAVAYLWVSDGSWPVHRDGFWQLIMEIESIAMSPLQEIPRLASNSIVNADFLRPSEM